MLSAHLVSPDDLAWLDGQAAWEPIRAVLGLAEHQPPPTQSDADNKLRAKMRKKTALSRVGGWLLFFCVGLTILGPLFSIGQLTDTYQKTKPALDRLPTLNAAMNVEMVGSIALLIYGFIVGCIIWSGSPSGRRIAREFLLIRLFGFLGIELIAVWILSPIFSTALSSGLAEGLGEGLGGIIREGVYFLIWWLYFKRSERVRNTYGPERT